MKNNIGIATFLEQLGSESPTPGGGAAAALTSALGASLIMMVTNNTIRKGKCGEHEDVITSARDKANELRLRLTDCIEKDAEAYAAVAKVYRMPRDISRIQSLADVKNVITETETDVDMSSHIKRLEYFESLCGDGADISSIPDEMTDLLSTGYLDTRRVLLAAVSKVASEVPLSVMEDSLAGIELIEQVLGKTYAALDSDLRTAARCLHSGILSSKSIVEANVPAVFKEDQPLADRLSKRSAEIVEQSTAIVHDLFGSSKHMK